MSNAPTKKRQRITSVRFCVPITLPSAAQPLDSWRAWTENRPKPKHEWQPEVIASMGVRFTTAESDEALLVPWSNIASITTAPEPDQVEVDHG